MKNHGVEMFLRSQSERVSPVIVETEVIVEVIVEVNVEAAWGLPFHYEGMLGIVQWYCRPAIPPWGGRPFLRGRWRSLSGPERRLPFNLVAARGFVF